MPTKAQISAENEQLAAELAQLRGEVASLKEEPGPGDQPPEDIPHPWDEGDGEARQDVDLFLQEVAGADTGTIVDGYRSDEESGDGKYRFEHRWPFSEFNLQVVKDTYGGGKWNFRLKFPSGKLIRSKTEYIGGPAKDQSQAPEDEDPRGFAEKIMDQQGLILDTLKEVRQGPPPGAESANPLTMAMTLVQTFDALLQPQRDLLQQMAMRDSSGGGEGPASFKEMMEVLKLGMEMGRDSAPEGSDPMAQVVAHTLPPLLKIIGDGVTKQPEPDQVLTNPPESLPPQAGPPRPPWDFLLAPYMPNLLRWAQAGANVELRAAFVVDELPPEAEALLIQQLQRGPEFFTEFMIHHPEARPTQEWFAHFWAAVADQFEWGGELGPHPFQTEPDPMHDDTVYDPEGHDEPDPDTVEVGTHPEGAE